MNMIHHDSFRYDDHTGKSRTEVGTNSGGHADGEGAASTRVQLHDPTQAHLTDRHLSQQAAGVVLPASAP